MLEINKIHNIDCLEGIKQLEENSIDLIVTDPPYQLISPNAGFHRGKVKGGFMGKEWDVLPKQEIWNEMFRVLKAGAFAFIMMTPRQDSSWRTMMMLERAGFQISFTPLFWAYASGFPKASNISKLVDKRMGVEREVIGTRQSNACDAVNPNKGFNQNSLIREVDITTPATPQAKALDGSYGGFQPKPAVELILVAMKPCDEKTYVNQALKNRKGITWLDDVRIPYESEDDYNKCDIKQKSFSGANSIGTINKGGETFLGGDIYQPAPTASDLQQGRFPANLLVSDDVLNDGNVMIGNDNDSLRKPFGGLTTGMFNTQETHRIGYQDSGSFSRYFDLDKWFINKLPNSVKKTFPFMIVPKASKGEKNDGLGNEYFLKENTPKEIKGEITKHLNTS